MDEKKTVPISRSATLMQAARVADGFLFNDGQKQQGQPDAEGHDTSPLDLGAADEAPPAYGELHDQLNLSQAGFNAGAAVTGEWHPRPDGRLKLADLTQTMAASTSPSTRPTAS